MSTRTRAQLEQELAQAQADAAQARHVARCLQESNRRLLDAMDAQGKATAAMAASSSATLEALGVFLVPCSPQEIR